MIKAVLFDLGNVVWDDNPADERFLEMMITALGRSGIHPTEQEVAEAKELAAQSYAPSLFRAVLWRLVRGDQASYKQVLAQTVAQFEKLSWSEYQALTTPFPDVHDLLAALRGSGFLLGVASNNLAWARERLEETGLLPYFHFVGISQILGLYKPDPRLFLRVLEEIEADPGRSVMVGDRLDMDVYPAHVAGMRAIRVRRGNHSLQQPRYPKDVPDADVEQVQDVLPILMRWKSA
jgi:putative hydrolase of the HAD superfamily